MQPLAGPTLRRQRTIKVEVLVHCSNKIWLGTLEAWLDPVLHTQIVKFEWSTIQRGQGKTYYAIPPSQRTACPSGVSPKKAGQRPWWREPTPFDTANAAGSGDTAVSTAAEADATSLAAPHSISSSASGSPAAGGQARKTPKLAQAPTRSAAEDLAAAAVDSWARRRRRSAAGGSTQGAPGAGLMCGPYP